MPQYKVEIPGQGVFNVESPTELTNEQAYMAVLRDLAPKPEPAKPAEPTIGGQVKEFAKGVIPGAIGMGQTALTGLAALLPQEQEDAARKVLNEGAEALKRPFTAAPGYEETVGRKFGEAVGSIGPFLAMGPLGAAGRAGMVGLGVGAGAGEARIRAEQEGATPEQRSTATALGIIPGAAEVFAPMQILGRLSTPIKAGITDMVKRALIAGGEEGAQEAASQIAQNLIAKGVYKPDQAIIEQVGESAAYGGATGALVQGIMDMALGRRAKGTTQPQPGAQQPAQQPTAGQVAQQVAQQVAPGQEAATLGEAIAEPTLRGETPEEAAQGPLSKAEAKKQAAQQKRLADEQAAFLRQYEEQAALREQQAAEYERVKALTPEEYALEQMQGIKAKKIKPTSQEDLNAQLAELGYQTEPTPPTPPVVPGQDYAAQQVKLAKDREPVLNNQLLASYLMQDPEQARELVQNQTPIPGVSQKDSTTLLGGLKLQLAALDKKRAADEATRVSTARERAAGLFQREPEDLIGAAREQPAVQAQEVVKSEREALERMGQRPAPYLTANRDIQGERDLEQRVTELVDALPKTDGQITQGDVYLGLGTRKQDVRDLQAQLAVARMTRNRDLQEQIKRDLDAARQRQIPTEGGLGTEGGKTAAEFISRSKAPEFRAAEAEGDKFAAEQRSTLLGLARLLASTTIRTPASKEAAIREAKEKYVAQHAAEIEARRKAFGLPQMVDWEIAEARARALEGLNTLTNNWGQFEDPAISVKALQNITREAVYQNIFKAAQRKAQEEKVRTEPTPKGTRYTTVGGKEMFIPAETGPRIAAPKELTLKGTPRRAGDTKQDAIDMVDTALTRQTRVSPTEVKRAATTAGSLGELANLFKKAEVGGATVDIEPATTQLLEQLRDALPTSTDPEFHALAREQAQRIVEGNLPNPNAVRELGDMLALQEQGKQSATRPGATPEELRRTSAQPQKELFPEAAVQTQRATVANFQKMLDSKNVQGMRDAIEQQRKDNIAALQAVNKSLPTIKNRLAKAESKYKLTQKKAEAAGTEAYNYKKEFEEDYSAAFGTVEEIKTQIKKVEDHLADIEYMRNTLATEPTDMRLLINAPTMLAQEKPLRATLKKLQDQLVYAEALVASINATNEAMQTLAVPAKQRADKLGKQLDAAQKELSEVKNEAARQAAKDKAAKERAESDAKFKEFEGTVADIKEQARLTAAQTAGQQGAGLSGVRYVRDTASIQEDVNKLRRKLGSLNNEYTQQLNGKRKVNDPQAVAKQIEDVENELSALYEKANLVKSEILTPAQDLEERQRLDRYAQQRAQADANERRKRKEEEKKRAPALPTTTRSSLVKDIRTGKVSQPRKIIRNVEPAEAITDKIIAKRAELAETQRRIDFLKANGKDKVGNRKTELFKSLEAKAEAQRKQLDRMSGQQQKVFDEEANVRKELKAQQSKENLRKFESETNQFARGVETTSPDLSKEQVSMLEKNDITGALDSFADDKNVSKLNKIVAQRLAAMLDNTNVVLENNLTDEDGNPVLGMATSKQVTLDRKNGLSQEVLLHEGTHAATERVIVQYEKDPSKLSEIQRVAVRELMALHKAIQNDPRITSVSAKGSLSEFVAEVFSNRNLQEQLRGKKWRLSDAWKGFKSIIMRMLGIKDPETMLGAALQSVDAILIPSSQRMGGVETAVTRQLSQKDIAALHTGSNSMKQFAENFGTTHIKQKDRTPEDANRIGQEYLDDMYSNPLDYIAPAEENRLDYSSRMSDGTVFDPNNPLHYAEADVGVWANEKAKTDDSLRKREAEAITSTRRKDLKSLIKNMMENPEFTFVEQALVAKAASKFAVLSDKSGKLKLAAIEPNNRHNIAVVSAEDAGRIIEELRAGKPLKQAFLDGMQKNANDNAKKNSSKNGWYKFDQVDESTRTPARTVAPEQVARGPVARPVPGMRQKPITRLPKKPLETAAEELNAACAGTPWCTGASVLTARGQISKGDFYVYYKQGRPEVAVRMDGTDKIGEVRGNSPNQALSNEQQKIAEDFLTNKKFEGSQQYLEELEKRNTLIAVARGDRSFTTDEVMSLGKIFNDDGTPDSYAIRRMFRFNALDGYHSLREEPSAEVQNFFANKVLDVVHKQYEEGNLLYSSFYTGSVLAEPLFGPKDIPKKIKIDFGGKEYVYAPEDIKMVYELGVSDITARNKGKVLTLPNLKRVVKINAFDGAVDLPALQMAREIRVYSKGTPVTVTTADTAAVSRISPATVNASLVLNGAKTVGSVQLRSGKDALTLVAPDVEYAKIDDGTASVSYNFVKTYNKTVADEVQALPNGDEIYSAFKEYETFWDDAVVNGSSIADAVETTALKYNSSLLNAAEKVMPKALFDNVEDDLLNLGRNDPFSTAESFTDVVFSNVDDQQKALEYIQKTFSTAYPEADFNLAPAKADVPNLKGDTPPVTVKEGAADQEAPRYAKAQAKGFEDSLDVAQQIIAQPRTVREKIDANLGLSFRTQFLDRLAPLEKIANEMLDPLRGTQMMYYLRMADQKMSFVQQAVARGVPQLVDQKRADGQVERLIESQNGPNLADVVTTLKQAPGMNAEAANQLFTLYLAGKRGDRVGYDKLNFGVPEDTIRAQMAKIESNKELRDVFEKAREQYNAYNRDLMRFMEQTGALSPEEAKRLASTNDYIPYYREENGNAVLVIGGEGTYKIGNLADQPQLRQLIGGNDKILDFLTSSVQNTSMLLDMGLRNQATKNAMYELADLKLAQFLGGSPSGADIVRFKDKGVDKYVRINTDELGIPADLLVKGMEGIPVNNSALVRTMGGFSTLLRRSITVSPLYSARQLFRDSLAAPLLSGANFTPVMGALKQLGKSDTRETLEARGIVGGQVFTGTNEDLTRILGELQAGKMGLSQFIARAEAIAMEADALTRRAQYDSYIEQGLSQMEATLMSLESMNFNRKGLSPSVRLASQLIPFFNAQIQSLDVLYRAMTGKMPMNERLQIQDKLFKRGALLAGTAIAYAMLMQDDDTYKNAQPDEKYGNFFVHVPGISEAIRVPVPFEIGYIFKSIPEAMVNIMANERGAEEAYKAFKNIAIQTIPGGSSALMPAAVKPLVENLTNYSFFTGRSLETKAEQMEKAEFRYRDNTSELAKQVGALTGMSPIKIENLIRGYTGGMGLALAQSLNFSMPTAGNPEQATKRLSDAAVIGPLFQPADAGGQVSAVYDRMNDVLETKRTYDKLVKEGRMADARALVQDDVEKFTKYAIAGNVQEQLGKVTQAMNAIKASSLSPDEKREQLDKLQALRIQIAKNMRGAL